MYTIDKEFRWEMGHRLKDHPGQCSSIHGHSYRAIVTLKAFKLDDMNMVLDFYHLKPVKEFIDREWDHHFMVEDSDPIRDLLLKGDPKLYEQFRVFIVEAAPTAENMSMWLLIMTEDLLYPHLPEGVGVKSVQIWETSTCSAKFTRDGM